MGRPGALVRWFDRWNQRVLPEQQHRRWDLGPLPTATSYINLMYRTLQGQAADPTALQIYVQELQGGLPISLAAVQFVTTDEFRGIKIQEIYQVLGEQAAQDEITNYVQRWFLNGGLAGIGTSLLATSANVGRIEAGQVVMPDMAAAAELQQLLLAAYTQDPTGFVELYGDLIGNCSDTQGQIARILRCTTC